MPRRAFRRPIYFREWREYRGLTQEQASERAGMSQETVSRIENGRIGYTQQTLEAFAEAYGCEPADLLRPPGHFQNDLAAYIMAMDEKRRFRAMRILKAAEGEEGSDEQGAGGKKKKSAA